jgi:hypothetical protein
MKGAGKQINRRPVSCQNGQRQTIVVAMVARCPQPVRWLIDDFLVSCHRKAVFLKDTAIRISGIRGHGNSLHDDTAFGIELLSP